MDIDKLIEEVERLDREATPGPWHRRDAETENGYVTSAVSLDTADEDGLTPCDLPIVGRTITAGIAGNDAALIAHYRTAAPLLAAEVKRLRAGGCARDQRTTQFCAEAVARDADIAKLRDQILDYQQSLHVTERERDMLRADLEAAAGEVLVPIPEPGTVAAKMLLANRLLKSEIHRLKRTMIEPTEQTGDEDSEHGAPVCVLCGRDIDVSAPFSTGPASGPAGRILGDDDSAHGECLDHARQGVA